MDLVILGLSVSAVGAIIVFAGLAMIIGGAILLRHAALDKKHEAKAPDSLQPVDDELTAVLTAAVAATLLKEEQEQLIAVLTAAVSAMWDDSTTGFVVRKVRRIQNSPSWQKVGREEQVYSRM